MGPRGTSGSGIRRDPVGPGQESVWDYPRPPRLETSPKVVAVHARDAAGRPGPLLAQTRASWRVLETSHPPVFYVPRADIAAGVLHRAGGGSVCEFKGVATYWDVTDPDVTEPAVAGPAVAHPTGADPTGADPDGSGVAAGAWSYEAPWSPFEALAGAVAFYPALFVCTVDGEVVRPQPGRFYGGWITDDVVGPFKGAPGTLGW